MHNPTRRPRTALTSAVALTATGLVAAALAAAPAGVAAQAPAHASSQLSAGLSSQPATLLSATPGTRAALAPAAAASSTKITTRWTWANGTKLTATKVTPTALPKSAYTLKVKHSQGKGAMQYGVLPNGVGLGLSRTGQLQQFTKAGAKPYLKGRTPTEMYMITTVGKTVYGTNAAAVLYRFDGPHAAPKRMTTLPLWGYDDLAITGGRVYFTRTVFLDGDQKMRQEVVSRPLTGGAIGVEAVGARSPRVTDVGILAVGVPAVISTADYSDQEKLSGIVKLGGGKATPFLKFSRSTLAASVGEGPWNFAASGRTLTLPQAGTAGQLVVNLRTKRAWNIPSGKGSTPAPAGVSGSLAAWGEARPPMDPITNKVYFFDVDRGTARVLSTRIDFPLPLANGRAVTWQTWRADGTLDVTSIAVK